MKKDENKTVDGVNIHDGHRKRLIALTKCNGVDNLSKIQAVETLLCFVFPRGDVNPLAHRLLERFHDFPTILEASVEDLCQVEGIGETAATKISLFNDFFFNYSLEKLNQTKISSLGEFFDYVESLLRYRQEEELFLFGVDAKGYIIRGRRFTKGTNDYVSINMRDISLYLSTHKVPGLIIVHNHPNGRCQSSKTDEKSFKELKDVLTYSNCILYDSIIVGSDGIYSMNKQVMMRQYSDNFKYNELLNG